MPLKLPTPPTPPTIDKGESTESTPRIDAHEFFNIPFKHEKEKPAQKVETPPQTEKPLKTETPAQTETPPPKSERKVTTPEDMARDAVANGAGALTKKTITRPDAENVTPAQNNLPATANVPISNDRQSRGKEILREFQNEDKKTLQTTEPPRNFNPQQNESHGGFYWIVTLAIIGILSIVFVKKILIRKNPPLKKSDLFTNSSERLKAVSEKVTAPKILAEKTTAPKIPVSKINSVEKISAPTQNLPPKKDDGKGKHFEVRV